MSERDRQLGQFRHAGDELAMGEAGSDICADCPKGTGCIVVSDSLEPLADGGIMVRACPVLARLVEDGTPELKAGVRVANRKAEGGGGPG